MTYDYVEIFSEVALYYCVLLECVG